MFDSYVRKARVVRVIDGDTYEVDVDLGFHTKIRERIRLLGVNTPEIVGEERALGLEAKVNVIRWIEGKEVWIRTLKEDSFGRWLADVFVLENEELLDLGDMIVNEGLGVRTDR